MNREDLRHHVTIAGLLGAGIALLLDSSLRYYSVIPLGLLLPTLWQAYNLRNALSIKKTGLERIYSWSKEDPDHKKLLRRSAALISDAKAGDEVLIIGRTNKHVLQGNYSAIAKALERGVRFKILLLDREALSRRDGPDIDVRALRLPNARYELKKDLGESFRLLRDLTLQCQATSSRGDLLVYRTGVLIQNSAVVRLPCDQREPMRLLYDFSFGKDDADKFVQLYKASRKNRNEFCNRLSKFYQSMFDVDASTFSYSLSYRGSADHKIGIEEIAEARMNEVLASHSEFEAIRGNALKQLVPGAVAVFGALSRNGSVPPPISAQIELTNKCSTHCAHCERWNNTDVPFMGDELAMQVLDDLASIGVKTVSFSGGEPTLHPEFESLLERASSRNLNVGILSNGVGLSHKTLRAIHTHGDWLRLSMDGGPGTFSKVRTPLRVQGGDAFELANATIEHFLKLHHASPTRCRLAICFTIQRDNVDDVGGMIRWVRSLNLPNGDRDLIFKFAHGTGDFKCTESQLRSLWEAVLKPGSEFAEAANIPYLRWFLDKQSNLFDIERGRPTESLYLEQRTRCYTPHLFTLIDVEGGVYPCCFLYDDNHGYDAQTAARRAEQCLGTIGPQTSFASIWEGGPYQELREDLVKIDPLRTKFRACGECTRHCNHNQSLTQLHAEYNGLQEAGGDADRVLKQVGPGATARPIWL